MRQSSLRHLMLFGLLLATTAAGASAAGTAAAAAAPSVMQLARPDIKRGMTLINTTDADLVAYLSDPTVECTFFAPTNQAVQKSMTLLGKNAGLAAQNRTLQHSTFNYHVLPGVALTAADLKKLNKTNTRANQTLYFMHRGGKTFLYSRPEYPIPLEDSNIKAGNCIVHTIDTVLVPVDAIPLIHGWLDETGTAPPVPPLAEWAPAQDAYLQAYVDAELKKEGKLNSTAAIEPAAAPAPAKSSAAAVRAIGNGAVGVIAGAALLAMFT